MKQYFLISLAIAGSVLVMGRVQAQQGKGRKPKSEAAPKKDGAVAVVLGQSGLSGGPVSKRTFDSLALQGLRVSNAAGNIQSFLFIYAERSLYEDSVGNPLLTTDYLSEVCYGDTLSAAIKENLVYRTKPGDTAYFDQIRVSGANGQVLKGRPMIFVLRP